ncbi:MAG TPA: MotA/TolQ/ExbB proton channel family protein [Gemmatimonadaceae bacterium]|nr:MotA/TolQ/ExbB proton channel family protein [Gemmatimonadaceae bacterium]
MNALLLQIGAATPSSPLDLIRQSTLATKIVLGILILLSLVSWAIMFAKWVEFRRFDSRTALFQKEFAQAHTLEAAAALVRRGAEGPYASIVARAAGFVAELGGPQHGRSALSASQVEALRLVLDAETATQRDHLAHFIPWLATIGSVSPLIGLLGTVLGVIDAFVGIAVKGSGNLSAVAPGVAEALVATAAALTVAIPAVFGYNIFAARLNRMEGELESFGTELIAMMVREGRIG